ncbi:MAG: ATP phosphoribosyltransferase regulatory subunit, partial [Phycisphaerales bacterium]|nr:ATP phosphoribosyltransferase regulatory subunit [Phycisphaerales bacterium]
MAAAPTHKFQAPKGTRDFFPEDMAIRRHVEGIWRSVSIDHGFDEIEGPTFEHLELYTAKSGDGIVSELFSFRRAGGETDYALRPEFTPTLARMAAARGAALARPTKWFCIPNHYRAERPQRGRLREFIQWNVDVLGDETAAADADVIAVGAGVLDRMGLTPAITQIRISHRGAVSNILRHLGVADDRLQAVFELLDRRDKMDAASFDERAATIGLDGDTVARLNDVTRRAFALG